MPIPKFSADRPILVTGSHRSGSTWVGRILAESGTVGYIHEPFNIRYRRPGVSSAELRYWLEYVPPGTEGALAEALADTLAFRYRYGAAIRAVRSARDILRVVRDAGRFLSFRLTRKRPLLKDPLAIFSAAWFHETFGTQNVVVIRHPAAFVSSVRRLQWRFPFEQMLDQPALIRDVLQPYEAEIRAAAATPPDHLEEAALLWKLIHHAITRDQERHPDWIYVRHEDLSMDPVPRFREIYARLSLPFTARIERRISESSSEENPAQRAEHTPHTIKLDSRRNAYSWRSKLTALEVQRIRALTEPYGSRFYSNEEW